MTWMFVIGGAMRGGPRHDQLGGAPMLRAERTAPNHRCYVVNDSFPALAPSADGGAAIAGELYDVPMYILRDELLPNEPPELELGIIELQDGASSLAMLLRESARDGATLVDITQYGSWRAYVAERDRAAAAVPASAPG